MVARNRKKIREYNTGFCVDRSSYLLWFPVITARGHKQARSLRVDLNEFFFFFLQYFTEFSVVLGKYRNFSGKY